MRADAIKLSDLNPWQRSVLADLGNLTIEGRVKLFERDAPVGYGKSTCTILAPLVVPDCRRAIAIVPPTMQRWYLEVHRRLRRNFAVPSIVNKDEGHIVPGAPVLNIISESALGLPSGKDLLAQLDPDLVISETHGLKYTRPVRTRRIARFCAERSQARAIYWLQWNVFAD